MKNTATRKAQLIGYQLKNNNFPINIFLRQDSGKELEKHLELHSSMNEYNNIMDSKSYGIMLQWIDRHGYSDTELSLDIKHTFTNFLANSFHIIYIGPNTIQLSNLLQYFNFMVYLLKFYAPVLFLIC